MPQKPSESEEEHFARLEMERRKELAARRAAEMAVEEREKLKTLHFMRCPKCGEELGTLRLRGVSVDNCASCGGLWLDAGELDELVANADNGVLGKLRGIFKSS